MNDDEIKANALVFLLAGFETVSNVLSFTLFHLAAHPEVLLKVHEEVDEKIGQVSIHAGYLFETHDIA